MLEDLFGGKTAEKVLLFIAATKVSYASEIAKTFQLSQTQTIRTLERLEQADILVATQNGRTRNYMLNRQWFLAEKLNELLNEALLYLPLDQQELYFSKRRKPRKKYKSE